MEMIPSVFQSKCLNQPTRTGFYREIARHITRSSSKQTVVCTNRWKKVEKNSPDRDQDLYMKQLQSILQSKFFNSYGIKSAASVGLITEQKTERRLRFLTQWRTLKPQTKPKLNFRLDTTKLPSSRRFKTHQSS